MVGGNYDADYSGFSIRGDLDIGTTTLEDDSAVLDGAATRSREALNDVTYAEYSKIITLQTRTLRQRVLYMTYVFSLHTSVYKRLNIPIYLC